LPVLDRLKAVWRPPSSEIRWSTGEELLIPSSNCQLDGRTVDLLKKFSLLDPPSDLTLPAAPALATDDAVGSSVGTSSIPEIVLDLNSTKLLLLPSEPSLEPIFLRTDETALPRE
jgi:hypothetical protein